MLYLCLLFDIRIQTDEIFLAEAFLFLRQFGLIKF